MQNRSGLTAAGVAAFSLAAAVSFTLIGERDAAACGGCFSPPENPTIVTDHRMVLSVSQGQTTLYDQIRYQGDPQSFAWVLPIAGVATVGLSSNVLFGAIDEQTQTQITPPANPSSAGGSSSGSAGSSGNAGPPSADGVTVLKAEQVGPYETVQLRSTDPQALNKWLTDHKFQITPEVNGIISDYVRSQLDFLALKLVPGATVKEMRPIRVTTAGASAQLPLKMVAAGSGATVGITLWIVAEGRYEPSNFAFFHIDDSSLVWDFATNQSNYKSLRAAFGNAFGGRAWEMESSIKVSRTLLTNRVRQLSETNNGGTESTDGYVAIPGGGVYGGAKTAVEVREDDLTTLFTGLPATDIRITRVRSDLAHAALTADLLLQASSDQGELSNRRIVTRLGTSTCDGCPPSNVPIVPNPSQSPNPNGSGNGSASPKSADEGSTFTCNNSRSPSTITGILSWSIVAFVAALAIRRRRKN